MRAMLLVGGASLLGGGAYVSGAFDRGEYYPLEPAAVESRLASVQFGPELGMGESDRIGLVLRSRGPAVLRWDVMAEGKRIADVRAHLVPEAPGTRVRVEFAFTDGDAMMGLEEDPIVNELAEIAMEEKVDAALDGRAFNETLVQAKMAAVVASNPQAVARIEKTIEEETERRRLRMEDELAERRGYGRPTASTKPMTSAKPTEPTDFGDTHADGGWGKKD
ncbi:hypothetical protein ACLBKU_05625 [Erythrobacter sp. NE805]|uniref:hypothetical protein n=1 Tax=Erythrobacter sp. NE805 TaxID=3389875 RepID=UPI00396B153A